MQRYDFFLNYEDHDLKYEFEMLIYCKQGMSKYSDSFLRNLCIEGWLLHARRIIEVFELDKIDKKWEIRRGLISEHLSHANPSNRQDSRSKKRINPRWDEKGFYYELLLDVEKVTENHKSEFAHYQLLKELLKLGKNS